MADIASWSPVDESNTAAPPSGWPENMQPSAVNNCARAMMGAIRRYYDTVNTQIASITTSIAGYLPLSGGTVTGNLTVNGSLSSANAISTVGANAGFNFAPYRRRQLVVVEYRQCRETMGRRRQDDG